MIKQKLKMLSINQYKGVNKDDPIRFYNLPLIGNIYRERIEKCLEELSGGNRILEIGFGSGVTFINLNDMYKEIHGLDLSTDIKLIKEAFSVLGVQTFLKNGNLLNLPYPDEYFDSVLLISILEHLKPESLNLAFQEVSRVLKPAGQVVYGVPVDKTVMSYAFRLLGYNIRNYHFSDQEQIARAAKLVLKKITVTNISIWPFGKLYEVGHFVKQAD